MISCVMSMKCSWSWTFFNSWSSIALRINTVTCLRGSDENTLCVRVWIQLNTALLSKEIQQAQELLLHVEESAQKGGLKMIALEMNLMVFNSNMRLEAAIKTLRCIAHKLHSIWGMDGDDWKYDQEGCNMESLQQADKDPEVIVLKGFQAVLVHSHCQVCTLFIDIERRPQNSCTAPCNGTVNHGPPIYLAFCRSHTQKQT